MNTLQRLQSTYMPVTLGHRTSLPPIRVHTAVGHYAAQLADSGLIGTTMILLVLIHDMFTFLQNFQIDRQGKSISLSLIYPPLIIY